MAQRETRRHLFYKVETPSNALDALEAHPLWQQNKPNVKKSRRPMDQKVIEEIRKMNKERDWDQFHTGENLAKSIAIESGELLELFQWGHEAKSVERLKEELADVLSYCYMLADRYGLDVDQIVLDKYKKNEEKYPISKSKGSSKKYDEFDD